MSWPWQRSIQVRIMAVVGGLLLAVLALVNAGMAYLLAGAELEEAANHLQIQALIAARNLQDPLSSYSGELRRLEQDDDDDDEAERGDDGAGLWRPSPAPAGGSLLPGWAQSLSRSLSASVLVSDLQGRVLVGEDGPEPHLSELEASRRGEPLHRWTGPPSTRARPCSDARVNPWGWSGWPSPEAGPPPAVAL